jgi:hypothetical protein
VRGVGPPPIPCPILPRPIMSRIHPQTLAAAAIFFRSRLIFFAQSFSVDGSVGGPEILDLSSFPLCPQLVRRSTGDRDAAARLGRPSGDQTCGKGQQATR